MFDGSHYPFEENIRLTKEIVKAAHAMGVSVEGELGTIGGVEDDISVDEEMHRWRSRRKRFVSMKRLA